MIPSIMKIGKWIKQNEGSVEPVSDFVQNPNEKGNIRNVITIDLNLENDSYIFQGVEIEEIRQKYLLKYLYRHGSSRGADITPTSKFAGDITKTFKIKILKSVQDICKDGKKLGFDSDEQKKIKLIEEALTNAEEQIIENLKLKEKEIEEREGAIITLVFYEDGKKQYIGDIELFKKVLTEKTKENYYKQYGKKSLGKNSPCFVCLEKKPEVFGFVNTYNFYTVDKPGFVTGGFSQKDAWKNYPVCLDCAGNLELGKKYLGNKMIFSFYGYRYILVPRFFSNQIINDTLEELEYTLRRRDNSIMEEASFKTKFINRLTNAEDEILEYIGESNDYVSFDLLFYQEKQAAFNILLHIEDVLPSRLGKLFKIKKRLDGLSIFKNVVNPKTNERTLFFNFQILRRFFPYISKTRSYDKNFLELTGKIFSLRAIEYSFVLKAITRKLRIKFARREYLKEECLAGYMLLNYIAELGILFKGGDCMDVQPIQELSESFSSGNKSISEKIDLFFLSNSSFFNGSDKKVCFLVGILVQKLLNIQWKDKKATPFRNKLHGLRLTEALVKKIFYQAQEKLEQYKKNYYRELEKVTAQYMVAGNSQWLLTNDEIAFYFTMGMNLSDLFKTINEGENHDNPGE